MDKREADLEVEKMAGLLEIGALLERRPSELSGGQQQRVALARALVRRPDVLLLDEPLANLDARLRLDMRGEIRRIQRETRTTAILVTHDQVEAMSMCDRIAIMDRGQIVQIAAPAAMYESPNSRFVASFLGSPPIAYLPAVAAESSIRIGETILPWPGDGPRTTPGTSLLLGIRPEFFGPTGTVLMPGRIAAVESHGRETLYAVDLSSGGRLRAILPGGQVAPPGADVSWGIDPTRILIFDESGRRL